MTHVKWTGAVVVTTGLALSLLCLSGSATATPIVFSGYDIGTSSLATSPNATAAASAFDGAISTLLIDFESPVPAGVSFVNGSITDDSTCAAELCGYNTTTGGSNFLLRTSPSVDTVTFDFAVPIYAFGAYFTGWQTANQTLAYGSSLLNMPDGVLSGGTLFFGFIDPAASITSITYTRNLDIVAIDDIRYAPVPEPATSALLLTGLGLLGHAARRRKKRSS